MAKNLVIVESPAKVKTIKKYLGSNYEVVASKGHVRDLPKSTMGIDVENDFEPKYITIRGKGDVIADLKKKAKASSKIYLATDPDREGEAISWHIANTLGIDPNSPTRITFNEITKSKVAESLKNPRPINMDLVDAQQARRVLDRLVGYGISPILWEKVKRGLSAGRVQSATLKMICDRDAEIEAFVPEEYWTLEADVRIEGEKKTIKAKFTGDKTGKIDIHTKEELDAVLEKINGSAMTIAEIKHSQRVKKAPLPFTTSSMQQEASKVLNFTSSKTMRVAQSLYEDGYITYLRTDSVRISDEALNAASEYVDDTFGKAFVRNGQPAAKTKNNVQDAHEAIRPSDIKATPDKLKDKLEKDSFKLYQLIWKRFTASRMTDAQFDVTTAVFDAAGYCFTATASKLNFEGFLKVYTYSDDEAEDKRNTIVSNLKEDAVVKDVSYDGQQHFTQPPAHFTEAALVKAMEDQGIGRPSTYAPTIATILARHYVTKDKKNLLASELGKVVNDIMNMAFPSIADVSFTANIEYLLDNIEEGNNEWKEVIRNFYPDLKTSIDDAHEKLDKIRIKDEVTDVICDKCGRNMVIKMGPHGKFLACPGFPECRNTKAIVEKTGVQCPECGRELIVRRTKKGRKYYGCEGYPECEYMSWSLPKKEAPAEE